MTYLLHRVERTAVVSVETFAAYAHQTIGCKYPTQKEMARLSAASRVFFAANPRANWTTLARTVEWARANHRHLGYPWAVITCVPSAFAAGKLPELDPVLRPAEPCEVDGLIAEALRVETNPRWLGNLRYCGGDRRRLYHSWLAYRDFVEEHGA